MALPHTRSSPTGAERALMTAVHNALRRDLDQLPHTTASPVSARARWGTLRSQLRFHLAAEHAAMWPRARSKLASDSQATPCSTPYMTSAGYPARCGP